MLEPYEADDTSVKPEKKARRKSPNKPKQEDTANLAKTLQGLHVMLAMTFHLPEMALLESEAQMEADAIQAVMAEYQIPISPATQALVNLLFVSFAVYAPRISAIRDRKKAEKEAKEDKAE